MAFKKYSVLADLLKLSQKSDEIIEKAFDSLNIDDHFSCTKSNMRQILNCNSAKCEIPPYAKRLDVLPNQKSNNSLEKILKRKSHVHVQSSNAPSETSCGENRFYSGSKECDDSGIIFFSSSDTDENCSIQKQETNGENPTTQDENFVEMNECQEKDYAEWREIVSESGVDVSSNEGNPKITLSQKLFQTVECTPDVRIQNLKAAETYVCKVKNNMKFTPENDNISLEPECVLRNKRLSTSMKKYCNRMGISLDGSFEESARLSHKVYFLDRTYVISSTSSEENMDCLILEKNSLDPGIDYSASHLNHNQGKEKDISESQNVSEDILNRPCKRKKARPSVILKDLKYLSERELEPALKKCGEIRYENDKLLSYFQVKEQHENSDFLWRKSSETSNLPKHCNVTENYKNYQHFEHSEKLRVSSCNTSSDDSMFESVKNAKGFAVQNKKECNEKGIISKKDRKVIAGRKIHSRKNFRKHSEISSAPARKRNKLYKQNVRPDTPLEFITNCNHQSLKDKAEEKRKQRELREQKTKERRERLERERKEKARVSEQRLQERFQQHEKILKEKVSKFKIKLRSHHQESTKRSYTPTSSRDSKEDMEEDNDGFCNVLDSGQKLSKKSNDYHEVSPKKVVPNSLEGNVGLDPEDSEKHNAILVSREKTPVELVISTDATESKKVEMLGVSQDVIRAKDSEESEQQDSFHCQPSFKKLMANASSKINNKSFQPAKCNSAKKRLQKDEGSLIGMNSKLIEIERSNEVASEQMCHQENIEKKELYFLRPSKKRPPNYNSVFPFAEKIGNDSKRGENSCETIAPTPKKSTFSQSCFKSCKKKLKKLKNPARSKIPCKNRNSLKTGKKKRHLIDVNNKENMKNEILEEIPDDEEQELMSYKISEPHENSFDESEVDIKKIPLWATSMYLKPALIKQYYKPPNVEELFGVIPMESIDLAAIFKVDKPEYHRRTSSEKWNANTTLVQ